MPFGHSAVQGGLFGGHLTGRATCANVDEVPKVDLKVSL
jgi:hypothetical protein